MLEYKPEPEPEPAQNHNGCNVCAQEFINKNEKGKCITCKNTCHIFDDLLGCYLYECEKCDGKVCYSCVKAAGGNKMHPFCSLACKAPRDALYLESRQGVKYVPA